MGERKVLNKYYPPDFDPAKIPRRRQPKNQQMKIRMMLPMSIRCGTCGNYIYKGTKFNSRKEDVVGETYLGIQIFRFYFKCTRCSAELTMKTDPQNSDYVVESGASRNFEPWRAEDEALEGEKQKRDAEEMGDAMKSLENRTQDSKREMDILAALDEVKSMKSRQAAVSSDALFEAFNRRSTQNMEISDEQLDAEDEALIKSLFGKPKEIVHRINDDDLDDEDVPYISTDKGETSGNDSKRKKISEQNPGNPTDYLTSTSVSSKNEENQRDAAAADKKAGDGKFIFMTPSVKVSVVRKAAAAAPVLETSSKSENAENGQKGEDNTSNGLLSLCQDYGSDDEDD